MLSADPEMPIWKLEGSFPAAGPAVGDATGPPYEAGLDAWLTGEAINGADVVVWYGAHFTHDVSHEEPGHFGHIVGPDLRRVKW